MSTNTNFEVYKDKKGGFRWRLLSKNHETVAFGEAYSEKRGAMGAVKKLKDWASTKNISDLTSPVSKATKKK